MKKRQLSIIAAMALATAGMASCASNEDAASETKYNPGIVELDEGQTRTVDGVNDFAWNFLGEVAKADSCESIVVSPLSMMYALGMVNNGACGETQTELSTVMGFSGGADEVNEYCRKLMDELPKLDKTTQLDIANCMLVNKDFTLKSDFKSKVKDMYDALAESRDFADKGFTDYINNWCNKNTQGMIPKIIDQANPDAVAYLMNALYFKGMWAKKFDKSNTFKEEFHKADSTTTTMDMMHISDSFGYSDNGIFKTLSMNYGNGSYSMQVLLPNKGKSVADIVDSLKKTSWKVFVANLSETTVDVTLPKFTIEYGKEMNKVLQGLGIRKAFDSRKADFSNFCDVPTFISKVIQKAKIVVDEQGTKAAAVTVDEMMCTSVGPMPDTPTFVANHPFVFVVTEHSTGSILFMGQVF